MSKGAGIKALRVETLNKVVSSFPRPKGNFFSGLFGTSQEESDTIRWMFESGSIGMTPFVAPGSPAPVTTDDMWWREGSARAAYYKEKRFFDEVFLNNMMEPEVSLKYIKAEKRLAKTLAKLKYRCERRREWMLTQMMVNGAISYNSEKGLKFTVDYKIPARHKIVLSTNDKWGTGSARNPVHDMYDLKDMFANEIQTAPKYTIMNSTTLRLLLFDASIQDLLKKSTFGDGDLFANPAPVLARLLGVGDIKLYDDMYSARSHVATNVSIGANTVIVEDVVDMEVGGKLRLYDMSKDEQWEEHVISSIDYATNTIPLATVTTGAYRSGRDVAEMRKKFVPDNKVMMFTDEFEGEKIAEFMEAPFGLGRHWGMFTDQKDEWDPDGIWVRVQDKGLPVLYNPKTIVTMTVA